MERGLNVQARVSVADTAIILRYLQSKANVSVGSRSDLVHTTFSILASMLIQRGLSTPFESVETAKQYIDKVLGQPSSHRAKAMMFKALKDEEIDKALEDFTAASVQPKSKFVLDMDAMDPHFEESRKEIGERAAEIRKAALESSGPKETDK